MHDLVPQGYEEKATVPLLPGSSGSRLKRLGWSCLLLACALTSPAASGQHYTFSNYGLSSGLSNLDVTALLEDHTGVVWVGTQNGVFTADGARFQKQESFSDLDMTYIRGIGEDEAGRIWVVDGRHLVYWEKGKNHPIAGLNLRIHGTNGVQLLSMPGQRDAMYLLHDGELLRIWSGDGGTSWRVSAALGSVLLQQHPELHQLSSVISGGGSTIWAGCGKAICNVNLRTGRIKSFAAREGLHADTWRSLLLTRSGTLWARGDHRLETLPAGSGRFTPAGSLPNGSYLNVQWTSMVEDPFGDVLVNLAAGVAKISAKGTQIYTRKNGMPQDEIDVLMFDRSGGLWLAPAGHGISHWLGYGNWEGWTKADGLSSDLVWAMPRDRAGNEWVASEAGLDRLDPRTSRITSQRSTFPFHRIITAVVDHTQHHVWVGDASGNVIDYDPETRHARLVAWGLGSVNKVLADREGRIWVCSLKGLDYFAPADNWSTLHHIAESILPRGKAYTIYEASGGILWVTTEMGLYRVNGNIWTHVRLPFEGAEDFYNLMLAAATDGTLWVQRRRPTSILHLKVVGDAATVMSETPILPSESVLFMDFDRRGWLWVGSDFGVHVFNGQRWVRCISEDGLLWDDTDFYAFFADPDGSVWIGTSAGVSHMRHPEEVFRTRTPSVQLTDVRLGESKLEEGVQKEFDLRGPLLSAHLLSTNYDREDAIVYRYRLEGQENDWQEAPAGGNLRFAALRPGSYRLSVVAFDQRLRESSAVHSVSFTVLEPWWNRGWFHLVEVLGAVGVLIGIWWLSRHLLVARQRELESLVASRTSELESSTSKLKSSTRQLQEDKAELLKTRSALIEMTRRDGLTGLLNRAAIFEHMSALCDVALRTGGKLAVVMADLDHFKRINDEYGHVVGDTAIRECADRIGRTIRPGDFVGRYGGEELLILMPGLDPASATTRMEELRFAIAGEPIRHGGVTLRITCSFGVAWMSEESCTLESLVGQADGALYQAKHNGRNRVEYAVREQAGMSKAKSQACSARL